MNLIAVLFCLALQRFANIGGWFQHTWFEAYFRKINPWLNKFNEWVIIFLVIVPILLLIAGLHFIFMWRWFGLFDLILTIMVLFFCIDARDLKHKLASYFTSLEDSNMHAAAKAVDNFIDEAAVGSVTDLQRSVTKAILLKSFEQVFVGLFWFMFLGIYGVLTYFLITLLRHNALQVNSNYVELAKLAAKIQDVFEWVPARVLGFTYSLVGHFNKGFNYCIKFLWSGLSEVRKYAVDSGLAALDVSSNISDADQSENNSALDIINRVLIIWLIAMALVSIGVWL